MTRNSWVVGAALCAGLLAGCIDRRYVITSDPPGALVLRNGQPIGMTPVDDQFVYWGNYHFTLIKDGYATLQVDQEIPSPWYEYFPLDFFTENVWPWQVKEVRRFNYRMQPLQQPRADQLLQEAESLRGRGRGIGPPPPPEPPPGPTATLGPISQP